MKNLIIALLMLGTTVAYAETPIYPTIGVFSPMRDYDKIASWTLPKRPNGFLVILSVIIRFDPAISDYITCKLPGMRGDAGDETVRFSVTFSETKAVTITGYVPGTQFQLSCNSEGQKLPPVYLSASMISTTADQIIKK